MRLLIGAAALALLFAAPAAQAQTTSSNCSDFAPVPTLPDGATADREAIEAGNAQYTAWGQARLAKLQLCRAEIEALRAQLLTFEQSYNSTNGELNSVVTAWQAEVLEFNERGASAGRRISRSGRAN